MQYTEQELKFLENFDMFRIPWHANNYKVFDKYGLTITSDVKYSQTPQFVSKSPDMFLALFKSYYHLGAWLSAALGDDKVCTDMKTDINIFFCGLKVIEDVTGKTFDQLCELWEKCE